jgi:hypothetical protein
MSQRYANVWIVMSAGKKASSTERIQSVDEEWECAMSRHR